MRQDISAQSATQRGIRMQRLHLNLVTSYVYNVYQGQLDNDSASTLVSKREHLSKSLLYDEVYDDGTIFPGASLIDDENIDQAMQQLSRTEGTEQQKLLLSLGGYYLYKPGNKVNDMDSAYLFLSKAKILSENGQMDKWKNPVMIMLGRYYAKKGEYVMAGKQFSSVIESKKHSGDHNGLAQALAEKGTYSNYNDPGKMDDLNRALKIFRENKDTIKQIEMLTRIFELYFIQGNFNVVKTGLLQIIDLEKAIGLPVIHYDYNVLAFIAAIQGNQREQFAFCNEAIRNMDSSGDYAFQDFFYIMMASLFDHLGDPTEARVWLDKSLDPLNPTRKERIWYSSFIAEIQMLARFYRPGQALDLINKITTEFPPVTPFEKLRIAGAKAWSYYLLNNMVVAKRYFNEAISEAVPLESEQMAILNITKIYSDAAIFFLNSGDIHKGEDLFNRINRFKLDDDLITDSYKAQILYKIDSSRGNYPAALKHFYMSKILDDSVNDLRGRTQLEGYRIKYELDKKDKDIQLNVKNIQLLTDETKLQESKVKHAAVVRNVMIGGTSALLLLLALLYNQYTIKRTKNLQLEVKQTEITNKNEALTKLLSENEWLLREVHHRVKNNLQIVMSLLNSQTAYLQDEAALKAVLESQHRVQTMSLIHQKLYKSKNVSSIYMPEYISDLVAYLKDSFKTGNTIHFDVDVEAIDLDVMHAVPVGLILNEVITNAIKYAFTDNPDASITIRFSISQANCILLSIRDNGHGFPPGFDVEKNGSFGMILIKGLTEDLDGTLTMQSDHGVAIDVRFRIMPAIETIRPVV